MYVCVNAYVCRFGGPSQDFEYEDDEDSHDESEKSDQMISVGSKHEDELSGDGDHKVYPPDTSAPYWPQPLIDVTGYDFIPIQATWGAVCAALSLMGPRTDICAFSRLTARNQKVLKTEDALKLGRCVYVKFCRI